MAEQLSEQITAIIRDLDLYTRLEVQTLAQNVNANLRSSPPLGTPRDTGWASANWVPSIGEPAILSTKTAEKKPSPAEVAARAAEAAKGINTILSWDHGDGALFSTNNVPYIGALNNGHSGQSPKGFVQDAIGKAIRETYSAGAAKAQRNRRAGAARSNKARPL